MEFSVILCTRHLRVAKSLGLKSHYVEIVDNAHGEFAYCDVNGCHKIGEAGVTFSLTPKSIINMYWNIVAGSDSED